MTSILEESKRSRSNGIFGFWKNKKIIIPLVLILIMGGIYVFWPGKEGKKTSVVT